MATSAIIMTKCQRCGDDVAWVASFQRWESIGGPFCRDSRPKTHWVDKVDPGDPDSVERFLDA